MIDLLGTTIDEMKRENNMRVRDTEASLAQLPEGGLADQHKDMLNLYERIAAVLSAPVVNRAPVADPRVYLDEYGDIIITGKERFERTTFIRDGRTPQPGWIELKAV